MVSLISKPILAEGILAYLFKITVCSNTLTKFPIEYLEKDPSALAVDETLYPFII